MATKDKTTTELTTTFAGMTEELPDFLKGKEDSSRGNESVTKDDLVIPRLSIIQAISPELDENDPAYIPGAKDGIMFNTLTKKLYTELLIIAVLYEKPYLLWRDRKKGGGFGGSYSNLDEATAAVDSQEDPDNWDVVDTPTHVCLAISDGKPFEIAIPMPKSKAKVSRQFNSMIRLFGGDRFSRVYKITTVPDKNNAGEKFKNFKVDFAGFPTEDLYLQAEQLYNDVSTGAVKYKVDDDYDQPTGEGTGVKGKDTPF